MFFAAAAIAAFGSSFGLACQLKIVEVFPQQDYIQIKNVWTTWCSGSLALSGNVRSSTSYGQREVSNFSLEADELVNIGNQTWEGRIATTSKLRLPDEKWIVQIWFDWVFQDQTKREVTDVSQWWETDLEGKRLEPNGILYFEEIHPQSDELPQYVEIVVSWYVKWTIAIQGLGRGSATKVLGNFELFDGNRLLVVDSKWTGSRQFGQILDSGKRLVTIDGMSLKDDGEILKLTLNGQVVDTVHYVGAKSMQSIYFQSKNDSVREFSYYDIPSPGADLAFLKYFLNDEDDSEETLDCWIRLQHSSPLFATNAVNLIATRDGKDISNANSSFECLWHIDWQAQLSWCNPSYIHFATWGIYKATLSIKNLKTNQLCKTTAYINLPNKQKIPSCREDYYRNLYIKRKDKAQQASRCEESTNSAAELASIEDPKYAPVIIYKLLPNPHGKDSLWVEKIRLKFNKAISLEGFYLKTNKKFPLHGYFTTWQIVDFAWDFKLANYWGCVSLFDSSDKVVDKVCFPKAEEGAIFSGEDLSREFDLATRKTLWKAKLVFEEDKVCVKAFGRKFSCKQLPYTKSQVDDYKQQIKELSKQNKSLQKEITKLQKTHQKELAKLQKQMLKKEVKLLTKLSRYKTKYKYYQQLYYAQKRKTKSANKKLSKTKKELQTKLKIAQAQAKLYKNRSRYLANSFKQNFYLVWASYGWDKKWQVVKRLDQHIANGQLQITLGGKDLKPRQVQKAFEALSWAAKIQGFSDALRTKVAQTKLWIKNLTQLAYVAKWANYGFYSQQQ